MSALFAVLTLVAASVVASGAPALAEPSALPSPTGPVLLTVSGELAVTNGEGTAQFDRPMLEALGMRQIETRTIWTDGPQQFAGVPLHALLARLGVASGTLSMQAINDYAVTIPVADAVPEGPILAILRNGSPMSLRDKGPIWLVYPYDSDPAYRSEVIYSRSIWQLDRISVSAR